jgi:penicillin-binding protein 1A
MINAVLAAEDDTSSSTAASTIRPDPRDRAASAVGRESEGGSTITMQLARGLFLSPGEELSPQADRDLHDVPHRAGADQAGNHRAVLEQDVLGQRAYGVGAAAEVYFGKTVDQLKLPEIALIAGTFRSPSRDNPVANADFAKQRRAYVLRRMHEKEFITQDEYDIALNAPVESRLHGPAVEVEAPYVAEMARAELFNRLGTEAYTAGYEAVTTLDSRLQGAACALRALR